MKEKDKTKSNARISRFYVRNPEYESQTIPLCHRPIVTEIAIPNVEGMQDRCMKLSSAVCRRREIGPSKLHQPRE
jgi:hypothetical protein